MEKQQVQIQSNLVFHAETPREWIYFSNDPSNQCVATSPLHNPKKPLVFIHEHSEIGKHTKLADVMPPITNSSFHSLSIEELMRSAAKELLQERLWTCHCNETFKTYVEYVRHQHSAHSPIISKPHVCSECRVIFT
jgi:hypothetical protein